MRTSKQGAGVIEAVAGAAYMAAAIVLRPLFPTITNKPIEYICR